MAYFNHAFRKVFVGTQTSGGGAGQNPNPNLVDGFLITSGISSSVLANTSATAGSNYGVGSYGFFNPATGYTSENESSISGSCCPLVLASAALYQNDKIGPYHGGYQESTKSKLINPKFIRRFYRVDPCTATNAVVNIGNTPYTSGLSPASAGCCFEFFCDETYYLRIDVKGSPALRFANHNLYRTLPANGGCCPDATPTAVNSTNIMIEWANGIVNDPYLQQFIQPVVYGEDGNIYYAPGTEGAALTWDIYDQDTAHVDGECAGLILYGAYVDTVFGDCSFQPSDYFEKEPIKILASMVDYTGDPCVFEGICVVDECLGRQGQGYGETVLRDLILSESYMQNYFSTDIRIREITQGSDLFNAISRSAQYTRYYILHSVPRYNNPTGVFDNDQYLLEIISSDTNTDFEDFMDAWLGSCADCVTLETFDCTDCTPVVPQFPS
jgi:hypothetical protein